MPLRYKPLNSDEIRLLRKLPSQDSLLHFRLETFPLSEAPPFWAFSYVWGDASKTSRIVVNGHNFEATVNLVYALKNHVNEILADLQEIEHPHFQAKYLWADAICINQSDLKERSKQVLRMRDIYQKGIVCIYLNTAGRDAYKPVYKAMSQICDNLEDELPIEMSERSWAEITQFFSKSWFHRMWMIQEFIMAESSHLMLFLGGHKAITDRKLRDAAWELFQHNPRRFPLHQRSDLFSGIKQYMSMADIKDRIQDGRPCSFLTLLWIFRDRYASDSRDKVYSLLGLLQANGSASEEVAHESRGLALRELVINYSVDVEHIYASLVKAMVIGIGSLNVICACQRPGEFGRSWVPDWSEPWSRLSLLANSIDIAPKKFLERRFKAADTQRPVVKFSDSLSLITVQGIRCDIVAEVGYRPPYQYSSDWIVEWFIGLDPNRHSKISELYEKEAEGPFKISACASNTEQDGFLDSEALANDYY